mgnify:CR=1 FL=1
MPSRHPAWSCSRDTKRRLPMRLPALSAEVSVTTFVEALTAEMVYCADPMVILPPASMFITEATVMVVAPAAAAAVSVVPANTAESLMPHA